jgi:O-6-methylguanine DNA methyltransferase
MSISAEPRKHCSIRRAGPRDDTILFLATATPIGRLHLAASPHGIVRIELPLPSAEACLNLWLAMHFPNATRRRGMSPILRKAATQLEAYFTGGLRAFSLPLDLAGTPFQVAVWQTVAAIPFAETRSYRDVAISVGKEKALRAVGAAQGANPVPIVVPCHRVIGSDGKLTGYGGGLPTKRWLLDHERELVGLSPASASWALDEQRSQRASDNRQLSWWGDRPKPSTP